MPSKSSVQRTTEEAEAGSFVLQAEAEAEEAEAEAEAGAAALPTSHRLYQRW